MTDWTLLTEEKLKSKIKDEYFKKFGYYGDKIDFCITLELKRLDTVVDLLWAEAKKGTNACLYESFVQLILTIGQGRYHYQQTPSFLGAFDAEKFAVLPYACVQDVFYQSNIDWRVTPSNHQTDQFQALLARLRPVLEKESTIYHYDSHSEELKAFISENLILNENNKYEIDKNNFVSVYFKWLDVVKDTITIDWDLAKKAGILDADFYLADLLSENNMTMADKLNAVLEGNCYCFNRALTPIGSKAKEEAGFKDKQKAHGEFWRIYKRPPRKEFWDDIINRRDLLVSQDIRERKGSFFTPQIWVNKSQEYIARALGEDWQSEYYIWDCAGGTGNLLAGLTNPRNIFISTLDKADVDVIKERIQNGAKIFENHVFQFDFLNDDFDKAPPPLRDILKDEEKRRKLVIYINPPYAEAASASTVSGTGKNKDGVALGSKIYEKYKDMLGGGWKRAFCPVFHAYI